MTFNLQEMDIEAQQLDRRPPSPNVMDKSCAPVDNEIALVVASVDDKVVINVSDVEFYGLECWLTGDSTDEDNDNDDEGITQRVEMPSASDRRAIEVDAPSAASTKAGLVSTLAEDKFYNATGKALHPDVIVPKRESGWWTARKE